jgi:cholesterol oxidase
MDFDAIIIGSGFGGAVSACRLSQAGYRVLVLERGRRYDAKTYPRRDDDPWWFSNTAPELWNGWFDIRVFKHMAVLSPAAVGGGSIVYANLSAVPHKSLFYSGWPPEITWDALAPHYETVGRVMNVQKVPDNQWPKRTFLMQEGAQAIGAGDRFQTLEVAVSFDPEWTYNRPDPFNPKHSKRFVNEHGVEQGTCVHLGNCDIGCDVDARNTLDRNYLAIAERNKAEVRPLHLVTGIQPEGSGYKVTFDHLAEKRRQAGSATARIVVLAAGSIGSTELLLQCRDVDGTLTNVSPRLGYNWSSNGDFLTPGFYRNREVQPTQGPTITSAINFLDGSRPDGQTFWIQDGGFPNVVANWLSRGTRAGDARVRAFLRFATAAIRRYGPLENVMPWFAQGIDAANGRLLMRRRWWLMGKKMLDLDWDITESAKVIEAIIDTHKKLSKSTGGIGLVPPSWSVDKFLITPHPLGGCNMGSSAADGVVDHKGEVFGHRNLFVLDGSIVPEALGVNPSRSIAALTERAMSLITKEGR